MKVEHQNIRRVKKKDEYLNWEDYNKMEFTQNVRKINFSFYLISITNEYYFVLFCLYIYYNVHL